MLFVPSVIVPMANAPDRNVLISHRAAASAAIHIPQVTPMIAEKAADLIKGMTPTRNSGSTTDAGSEANPILQVPIGA